MAFHGPQPSGECVLLGIPKGHPSRDRPGVWEESDCLTSFQIWPPHRNLWREEWIVIWGCIKTNLAIFGGMNIHLPVIWGSLGYQGFDSYPYLMISTTSPSQRGPFPARSMACPWDKSAGDCTTSSMVIRCHGENSKNATMRPGKFTTIDWVWKRSTGIYNIYICIIIYIV